MTLKNSDQHHGLQRYVEHGSEEAFRELTTSYVDFVYSIAWRRTHGDSGLAEDIVQVVFTDLARKAAEIENPGRLGGWLHRHTCFVASNVLRGEQRRRIREQEAATMNHLESSGESTWTQLAPELDEAIDRLHPEDRNAIIQRFFERRSLREIGVSLGASEDAIQKRVQRALDRLRKILLHQGVTLSSVSLVSLLGAHAVKAAPIGLALAVSSAALVTTSALTPATPAVFHLMNAKLFTASAVVLTGIATVLLLVSEKSPQDKSSAMNIGSTNLVLDTADVTPFPATPLPLVDRPRQTLAALVEPHDIPPPNDTNRFDQVESSAAPSEGTEAEPPFTAPIRVRVGSGQTLVTGGWATKPGKVTFVFVTPETNPASDQVTYRSSFVEIPDALIQELGLSEFKSEGKTSSLDGVLDGPDARIFLAALKETEGVNFLSSPTVMTLDGRQARVTVGSSVGSSLSMDLLGTLDSQGQAVDLEVLAELKLPSEPLAP